MREELTPVAGQLGVLSEDREDRGGTHWHQDLRLHCPDFSFEPWIARANLHSARLLVQAALAALFELEVLYGICHVHEITIDTGLHKRSVEEFAGGPNEGFPLLIF